MLGSGPEDLPLGGYARRGIARVQRPTTRTQQLTSLLELPLAAQAALVPLPAMPETGDPAAQYVGDFVMGFSAAQCMGDLDFVMAPEEEQAGSCAAGPVGSTSTKAEAAQLQPRVGSKKRMK